MIIRLTFRCAIISAGVGAALLLGSCAANSAANIPTATLSQTLSSQGYHSTKMQRIRTNHDLVRAAVNGVEGMFIVDTGASFSIIHAPRANRFALQDRDLLGTRSATMVQNTVTLAEYRIKDFTVNAQMAELPRISVTDISALIDVVAQTGDVRADGIIGQDMLIANQAVIDVGAGRLYWRAP